jgi:6-pyruvoyltetrahydropterin/6-carboxytetrahydropterin synthase
MENECFLCGSDKTHVQMLDSNSIDIIEICDSCQNDIESGLANMTVYKTVKIDVAHKIPGHKTCGKMHGHTIKIGVGVRGCMDLGTGMVIDFKSLKEIIQKEVVDRFDHSCLNDTLPIPTAEYLAYYIHMKLTNRGLNIVMVRVHETEDNYVEYKGPGYHETVDDLDSGEMYELRNEMRHV